MTESLSYNIGQQATSSAASLQGTVAQSLCDFEQLLEEARPRLRRAARMNGIVPDALDDVVQETLFEAWRHRDHFQAPWHFDAWLQGICRNVCRRHVHFYTKEALRLAPTPQFYLPDDEENEYRGNNDIPDSLAPDPLEELHQHDLAVFLERALGFVSPNAREALELYYLAEFSQREAALRLGIATHTFEMRLQRARRALRQVVSGVLRAEAEAFDLVQSSDTIGWRETREWCCHCGRNRLTGKFERQADGQMHLRMRCPACSPGLGDMIRSQVSARV